MAEITNSVGSAPSANLPHDVALIQAILKVTLSPKGRSYFPEKYNGRCGKSTISAIEAFQADHATAAPSFSGLSMRSRARLYTLQQPMLSGFTGAPRLVRPLYDRPASVSGARYQVSARTLTLQDELGAIRPGWPTMRALSDLLPPDYKGMRTAEGSHLVYWAGSAKAAADSATAIASDTRLNQPFREKVADLVQKMFDSYEIVLAPASGSNPLRTFQDQYKIRSEHPERTQAGPGESNHNYGQAIDIGFVGLKWMKPTGAIVTEGSSVLDLAQLSHVSDAWRKELWRLRGDIAYTALGLFPTTKKDDEEHIQAFSDGRVSTRRSLASLLTLVGTMKWQVASGRNYKCDLGFSGATMHEVGEAMQIWAKTGPIQKSWIAVGRHVAVAAVTDAEVAAMRNAPKADFVAAEAAYLRWIPIP